MRKKMLFLVNPKAGHGDVRNNLMEILQIFTQGGYDVTVHPTSGPRDITQQIAQYGEAYDKIVSDWRRRYPQRDGFRADAAEPPACFGLYSQWNSQRRGLDPADS